MCDAGRAGECGHPVSPSSAGKEGPACPLMGQGVLRAKGHTCSPPDHTCCLGPLDSAPKAPSLLLPGFLLRMVSERPKWRCWDTRIMSLCLFLDQLMLKVEPGAPGKGPGLGATRLPLPASHSGTEPGSKNSRSKFSLPSHWEGVKAKAEVCSLEPLA